MPHDTYFHQLKPSSKLRLEAAVSFFDLVRTDGVLEAHWMVTGDLDGGASVACFDLAGVQVSGGTLPASLYDARVTGDAQVVMLGMRDAPRVTFNGQETLGIGLAIGRRGTAFRAHWSDEEEHAGLTLASFIVPNELAARDWPETGDYFQRFDVSPEALGKLRSLVHGAFVVASSMPDVLDDPQARTHVRDSIFDRLSEALRSSAPQEAPRITRDYMHLALAADQFLDANQARPIYSAEVAKALGVGQRTLHNVMMQINGIPLHRYIRLRRLQAVRKALLAAPLGTMVKQCALDAGFRHLGRFSTEYFKQFGEMPSDTISHRVRYPTEK